MKVRLFTALNTLYDTPNIVIQEALPTRCERGSQSEERADLMELKNSLFQTDD